MFSTQRHKSAGRLDPCSTLNVARISRSSVWISVVPDWEGNGGTCDDGSVSRKWESWEGRARTVCHRRKLINHTADDIFGRFSVLQTAAHFNDELVVR